MYCVVDQSFLRAVKNFCCIYISGFQDETSGIVEDEAILLEQKLSMVTTGKPIQNLQVSSTTESQNLAIKRFSLPTIVLPVLILFLMFFTVI